MGGDQLITILSPTIGVIFTLFLLPLWANNRSRSYILYFIGAFVLYTLATSAQLLLVPGDTGRSAPITSILYLTCLTLLAEGCLRRHDRTLNHPLVAAIWAATLIGTCYYYYIDKNLIARIYILSAGSGLLLATAAYRLHPSRKTRFIDKVVFSIFVLISAQVFIRPLLTGSPGDVSIDPEAFRTSPFWQALHFSLVVSGIVMGLTLLSAIVIEMIDDLKQQSVMDVLTSVYNRRGFDENASRIIASGSTSPICLAICDIDHFKSINDTYGHPRGDRVLRDLANLLRAHVGKDDLVGRIGGEEFAVLLTGSTLRDAYHFSERVRTLFEASGIASFRGIQTTTASFGIAEHIPGETLQQLMSRADSRLYTAKKAGRNRICSEDGRLEYRVSA